MNKNIPLMICLFFLAFAAHAVGISGQGTWESTLLGRDLDGDLSTAEAYYDTELDITWLADANYAGRTMDWYAANYMWAVNLNPYNSGVTGWRLPHANPIDGSTTDDANLSYIGTEDLGYNVSAPGTMYAGSTASEMAHLFYNTLGNQSHCDPALSTTTTCVRYPLGSRVNSGNPGPFTNLETWHYWSATEYALSINSAWEFSFIVGFQGPGIVGGYYYAWAVHDGDVGFALAAIPVPATAWLFGSGLLSLIGVTRRKKAA